AAASRRSLQACIASLPLQSSWMSKTYLKSDHFNGGGSPCVSPNQVDATVADQRRRHAAHGTRCPRLHASAFDGSGANRPVAKGGPITPGAGRCRRCQQATRTRVAL